MKARHWLVGGFFLAALIFQGHSQQIEKKTFSLRSFDSQQVRQVNFKAGTSGPYATDHILVEFDPVASPQSFRATVREYGIQSFRRISHRDLYRVDLPEGSSVEEMLYVIKQNAFVKDARPDYVARVAVTPNDTFFKDQYALSNTGQPVSPIPGSPTGKVSADIKATTVWEETKGSAQIIIAVVDTGVELTHPDLDDKIVSLGWDFVNDDSDASDDHGHGTFVAGIAAAETNNSEGIAGVAWNCSILPVKCLAEDGQGFYSDVIAGIDYAVEQGAHVINLSLGGDVPDPDLEDAVRNAVQNGLVVVAASGNDSGANVLYPAKYDLWVLAVAATDYNDIRPAWSNYGPEVDVAAPGDEITSTVPTWLFGPGSFPYGVSGGTSYATPHVAGMAALIMSEKSWMSASDIMKLIRYSADDVNAADFPGKDEFIGYGRINLSTALVPTLIKK